MNCPFLFLISLSCHLYPNKNYNFQEPFQQFYLNMYLSILRQVNHYLILPFLFFPMGMLHFLALLNYFYTILHKFLFPIHVLLLLKTHPLILTFPLHIVSLLLLSLIQLTIMLSYMFLTIMLNPLYNLLTLRFKICTQFLHILKITLENPQPFML